MVDLDEALKQKLAAQVRELSDQLAESLLQSLISAFTAGYQVAMNQVNISKEPIRPEIR